MKKILLLAAALMFCAVALHAQGTKFGIKSGHLKYETKTSGGMQYNELWFDDYGKLRKQYDKTPMEGMGLYQTEVLLRDGKSYTNAWFDDAKKDEAKMTESGEGLNLLDPTDEYLKENKVDKLGTEEVFGKTCTIYTFKVKSVLRTVTYKVWVWQGITLKMETKGALGANNSQIVTLLEENVKVPASTFALPKVIQ
ncbi:MAG: hypothetical protein IKP15_02405 [Bacteroidales bacterium]|nr:hypothetical protein [Bacteroidales bacterium]